MLQSKTLILKQKQQLKKIPKQNKRKQLDKQKPTNRPTDKGLGMKFKDRYLFSVCKALNQVPVPQQENKRTKVWCSTVLHTILTLSELGLLLF